MRLQKAMKKKYATFSVNCTCTVPIYVPEDATEEELERAAWDAVNSTNITTGNLENDDYWELMQIDD